MTVAVVGLFDRPTTGPLVVAIVCTCLGWVAQAWAERSTRSPRAAPGPSRRPDRLTDGSFEPPAVVGLLTNEFTAPRSAVTATALDLAARGWISLTTSEDELVVVTRGSPAAGDSLRPFEQQVLNHLASRAFNDVSSANTLAASQHRLDRRWWMRFERAVAADAAGRGLSTRRYSTIELAPPVALMVIGLVAWWLSAVHGEEVAIIDSWISRTVWLAVLAALVALGWHVALRAAGGAQRPTELGGSRRDQWMGFRKRLVERIPPHATVLAPPAQQEALAQAVVMGVATHVIEELPVAPEHARLAWTESGDVPHIVRVHYPFRPGYGQQPLKMAGVGVVVLLAAWWLRHYLNRIADGEALESLLERVPGQVDLIRDIAEILAVLCWLPLVWAGWVVVAGAIDAVATRVRIGAIVRARRPSSVLPPLLINVVRPFAERDRFSTYLAVDDGSRRHVWAWLANERSAAPQGAHARVRATPLLGFVRSSEPVGTATRGG